LKPSFDIKEQLNPESITKQLPFILFLFLLGVIYIYNNHLAESRIREINKLKSVELKELRCEYLEAKNDLELKSMQTQVAILVDTLGLHELTSPPMKIRIVVHQK
jgi:hypothetical protein